MTQTADGCKNCEVMENTFNKTLELLRIQREQAHDLIVQEQLLTHQLREQLKNVTEQLSVLKDELNKTSRQLKNSEM